MATQAADTTSPVPLLLLLLLLPQQHLLPCQDGVGVQRPHAAAARAVGDRPNVQVRLLL
jgi:hypothetical protein